MTKYQNPHIEEVYVMGWGASSKTRLGADAPRLERRLVLFFVLFSAGLSAAILGFRNLFDDELFSLPFVSGRVGDILAMAREGDVHPPGMYLLAHAAWRVLPSYRWLNLAPLLMLYAGLAVFLLNFLPRWRGWKPGVIVLVLATLHPELLMWSNTFRWYCPWTGLALLALVLFLEPRRGDWRLTWAEAAAGGLLLAAMFYLNYITLLFVVALAPALWVRLGGEGARRGARKLLPAAGVFLLLIAPQLHTMVAVHLANSRAQRSGIVVSTVRVVQALVGSEAYLPWHPLALAGAAACVVLLVVGIAAVVRVWRDGNAEAGSGLEAQCALVAFGVGFLLLVALSGLGGKPRNAILLAPVFAPAAGMGAARLRGRWQSVVLGVLAVWAAVGAVHLLGRFGLQKANMNDRPEQVVSLIARAQASGPEGSCGLVVTYDSGVAFALAQARVPRLMILSPYRGMLFAGTIEELPPGCARPRLYIVESYKSGEPDRDWKYTSELKAAEGYFEGAPLVAKLSRDADAAMKRRLSRLVGIEAGESLPDFRFVVLSGAMERARLAELRRTLHYFVSWEEVVPDRPGDGEPGTY